MPTIIRIGGGYQSGYDDGHADGYNSGMTNGYSNGYNKGKSDGYSSGHADGYNSGYNTAKLAGTMEQISIGSTTTKDYKFIACTAYVVGNRVRATAGSVSVAGTYSGTKSFRHSTWGYVAAIDGDVGADCLTTIYFDVKSGAKINESSGAEGDVKHSCYGFN